VTGREIVDSHKKRAMTGVHGPAEAARRVGGLLLLVVVDSSAAHAPRGCCKRMNASCSSPVSLHSLRRGLARSV
jgi:hypothetical protein